MYIIVALSDGLDEFRQAFSPLPVGWQVRFVGNTQAALKAISEYKVSVIITDHECGRGIQESLVQDDILLVLWPRGIKTEDLEVVGGYNITLQPDMTPTAISGAIIGCMSNAPHH